VLTNIIRHRLELYVENTLGEYQGSFRAGRSTTDQLYHSWQKQLCCLSLGMINQVIYIFSCIFMIFYDLLFNNALLTSKVILFQNLRCIRVWHLRHAFPI
jgi:hypothetical protein